MSTTTGAAREGLNGPDRLSPGSWFPARHRRLRPAPGEEPRLWDRGVWCGLVASGGTCGWIGMGEL